MLLKNETEETIKVREGSLKAGYRWFSVAPGQEHEGDETLGLLSGLTKVEDNVKETPKEDPKDADAGFQKETKQEDVADYMQKLIDINGIGKVYAKKIIKKYPTIEILKAAIQNGEEIHKRDDVDEAVKETFGN
jgi:5'-3' exonuclease